MAKGTIARKHSPRKRLSRKSYVPETLTKALKRPIGPFQKISSGNGFRLGDCSLACRRTLPEQSVAPTARQARGQRRIGNSVSYP